MQLWVFLRSALWFYGFLSEAKIFQQSWQDEDLEIFESMFTGRLIMATVFYSWYLPKGQSYKETNLGFCV